MSSSGKSAGKKISDIVALLIFAAVIVALIYFVGKYGSQAAASASESARSVLPLLLAA
jgi:hypothetical protein